MKWRDGVQQLEATIIETRIEEKAQILLEKKKRNIMFITKITIVVWMNGFPLSSFVMESLKKAPKPSTEESSSRPRRNVLWKRVESSPNTAVDPTLAALEQEHEETTKVKNISKIYIG